MNKKWYEILVERGYESHDERMGALAGIADYPPPYRTEDLEEKLNWWEFCRALQVWDFTFGDVFSLNGVTFQVVRDGDG